MPDAADSTDVPWYEKKDSIEEIVIVNGISEIAAGAFSDYGSLEKVTIPESVTSIGKGAFDGCDSLAEVTYKGTSEMWAEITIGADNDCLNHVSFHFLSAGSSEETGFCGENVRWSMKGNTLTISGSGAMDCHRRAIIPISKQ